MCTGAAFASAIKNDNIQYDYLDAVFQKCILSLIIKGFTNSRVDFHPSSCCFRVSTFKSCIYTIRICWIQLSAYLCPDSQSVLVLEIGYNDVPLPKQQRLTTTEGKATFQKILSYAFKKALCKKHYGYGNRSIL